MTRMEICLKYMYRRFRGISTTQKYSTVCMYVLLYKFRAHLHQFYVHTYSTYTYVRMYTLHTPSTCGSVMRLSSRKCYICMLDTGRDVKYSQRSTTTALSKFVFQKRLQGTGYGSAWHLSVSPPGFGLQPWPIHSCPQCLPQLQRRQRSQSSPLLQWCWSRDLSLPGAQRWPSSSCTALSQQPEWPLVSGTDGNGRSTYTRTQWRIDNILQCQCWWSK